jgi:hypothetical protein
MLGWLLVAALVIIWAVFLFPFLRRRRSPVTTVEEFEQKMDFLAETNVAHRGRWVLTPRKGERFLGDRVRSRSRVRERRRQVFTLLLEATGLALLIGLFPPFHEILYGAAVLGALLLVYTLLLLRIRSIESQRSDLKGTHRGATRHHRYDASGMPATRAGTGHAAMPGWATADDRRAPAASYATARRVDAYVDDWASPNQVQVVEYGEDPIVYVDDDVHIVVHRSEEYDLRGLRAAVAR